MYFDLDCYRFALVFPYILLGSFEVLIFIYFLAFDFIVFLNVIHSFAIVLFVRHLSVLK